MAAEPEPAPAAAAAAADEEEEDDDDDLLGFNLFEGETPKIVREFNDLGGGISLSVTCLDEEPIGVQSGQLLWPAAPALCRHLIASWESLRGVSAAGAERGREQAVLELGAGCGMVGITAAKLGCSRVVMTDRDLGALELIEQNVSAAKVDASCTVLPLSWHAHAQARPTAESTGAASGGGSGSNDGGLAEHAVVLQAAGAAGGEEAEGEAEGQQGYPLIVAADVIYALEVVSMLFGSVNTLLATVPTAAGEEVGAPAPLFLMCQSFGYDDATEAEIDRCSVAAGLRREVLIDQLQEDEEEVEGGAVKIQAFTREPPPALA